MKNVLLPTDFTIQSLRPIHEIAKDYEGQQVTIHVIHFISMPTSIIDLLFISQSKPFHAIPAKFSEAYQLLQNKYHDDVISIVFDFVFCNSSNYLNNFLEGNNIDAVYMLKDYNYIRPLKQSEYFLRFFNNCKVPLNKLAIAAKGYAEYENFSVLLNSNEKFVTPFERKGNSTVSYN